jgi:hypothetical protein
MIADGLRHGMLPYGEVRSGRAELAIGFESLPDVSPSQRALYEQAVAAARVRSENVLVIRVTEAVVEVDTIDFDDDRWPVRTLRVGTEPVSLRSGR